MHLDAEERGLAMARIAALLMPGGQFFVNLRHGPVPDGRHMFDVSSLVFQAKDSRNALD